MNATIESRQDSAQISLIAAEDTVAAKPKRARKPRQPKAQIQESTAASEVGTSSVSAPAAQPLQTPPVDTDAGAYNAVIKVIGVGGGGGNAVAHMIKSGLKGVEFIVANTDAQAIKNTGAKVQLQIGRHLTKHLGAGLIPETGRQAALEDKEAIIEALQGADMVFIAAGMGGGTGTGAAPIVAQLARELDILTVAVVTKPFHSEGRQKMQIAQAGIEELALNCDSLITIPNEKIFSIPGRKIGFMDAFRVVDDVLLDAVRGIYDLIVRPGLMNVDFADVRTIMRETSVAMMGTGRASGDDRAQAALEGAIQNPLLDEVNISGATGILVNIIAGPDFGMHEYGEIGRIVESLASKDATTKIGFVPDPDMGEEIQVTVIATGLSRNAAQPPRETPKAQPNDNVLRARPKIELVRSHSGRRDGTTGMWVDDPLADADSGESIASRLRSHVHGEAAPEQTRTALSAHDAYLDTDIDIPAFLRRQCD